jgi:mono/diheme cytochrome c family protein
MIHLRFVIILSFLTLAAALGATSDTRWQQVPARDHARSNPFSGQPEAVAAGAVVYREHCQQCHKQNAQGDGHKRPALRSERLRAASDGDLEWFLRQGDLRRGMPSWSSLPQQQRWQLIAYLRSLQ